DDPRLAPDELLARMAHHGDCWVVDVAVAAIAVERDEGVGDAAHDGGDLAAPRLGLGARRLRAVEELAVKALVALALDGARHALRDDLEQLDIPVGPAR